MKNEKGFTMVELLVVIAIIGILLTIAIPGIFSMSAKMKDKGLNSKIDSLETAAITYAQENSNAIKSELKKKPGMSSGCVADVADYCECQPNSKTKDCKYIYKITVQKLVDEGAFKSETEGKDDLCDVSDPTDNSKCMDCAVITIKLDDDYKTATAKLDKTSYTDQITCN